MRKINSYEEYAAAVSRIFRKRFFYTNNIVSAKEMQEKIKNGFVYIEEGNEGVWILVDAGEYFLAYVYLLRGEKIPFPTEVEKPVIAELIGTHKKYCTELEGALIAVGFTLHGKNLELVSNEENGRDAVKAAEAGKRFFAKHGFVFHDMSELSERCFNQIWKLWTDTIDIFAIHKLTYEEYGRLAENDRGVFVTDNMGNVAGAGYYEKNGVISLAHHIAVSKKYNGLGLGGTVMNECAAKAFREGTTKYISWIADDNKESINIHKSIGVFTGKYSKQFILRKGEKDYERKTY